MTHTITFHPSGRTCPAEANETVLQACLRAGLSPDYGCSNGNCGQCKARLRSGQVEQVRHHDHALTESEKAGGAFLMCSNRVVSDIEIVAEVSGGPEDIPQQEIETRVKAVDFLDAQVARLHVQTPRSQRLRFISGQSVRLEAADGSQTTLAIASCPCDDRNLYFHIPDIPGDAFSELVFGGGMSARDPVRLTGPLSDDFYLDQSDQRHSIILCWHTGFAPVISLMEHAMSLEVEKDIHLFRFSPTPGAQYLANLSRSWADAYDTIFTELVDRRVTLLSTVEDCTAVISEVVGTFPDLAAFNVYVAGPPNFAAAARQVFTGHRVGSAQLRTHTDWAGIFE